MLRPFMHDRPPARANEGWPTGPSTPMAGNDSSKNLLLVAIGCAGLAFTTLCSVGVGAVVWGAMASGGGGSAAPGGSDLLVRAQITSYVGSAGLPVGSTCELPIETRAQADGSTLCHVRLSCSGVPLYGNDENGFFPCVVSPGSVSGQDFETTSGDRDGAFMVNTSTRMFEAHDDAMGPMGFFAVTGTILSVE